MYYILKGVTDALFLCFETTTFELHTKTNAEVTSRRCYIYFSVSVLRGLCVLTCTLYGCLYILQRGCLLCLFYARAVVGLGTKQAEVKHPRLFLCCHLPILFHLFAWDVDAKNT